MRVLSLFDGMSCGQIAFERSGLWVREYYASEVDKYAIKVTQDNYPDTIQLGDVTQVRGEDLGRIDLLIGGSPCQGFSFAGEQLAFFDPRSKLFFEYVRILKEVEPEYFLLENVNMKKEYLDIISEYLGVEPIRINSSLVSAQKGYGSQDQRAYYKNGKHGALTAGSTKSKVKILESKNPLKIRKLTPVECERLQTVPDGYTSSVSNEQRYKMLGNGWTVDVIVHLFKGLEKEFF